MGGWELGGQQDLGWRAGQAWESQWRVPHQAASATPTISRSLGGLRLSPEDASSIWAGTPLPWADW